MVVCLIVCTIRAFSTSSLEAATAMLLEEEYGLGERSVGLLIGASFMLALPTQLSFDRVSQLISKATYVRVLMGVCVLGSFMLREDVGQFLSGGATSGKVAVIICADMLLFPAMYLTGAVVEGAGFRLVGGEGTLFSTNNYTLGLGVFATGFGRSLGPPCARLALSVPNGQTAYSWLQTLVSAAAVVLLEYKVMAALPKLDEERPTGNPNEGGLSARGESDSIKAS